MGTEHRHGRLARELWEALSRGDSTAILELTAPDLVWRTLGDNPYAIETKRASQFLDLMASFGEAVDDLRMEIRDIFPNDRGAVLHYGAVAWRGSERLVCEYLVVMRMESGVVVEATTVPFDNQLNDEFWCKV